MKMVMGHHPVRIYGKETFSICVITRVACNLMLTLPIVISVRFDILEDISQFFS